MFEVEESYLQEKVSEDHFRKNITKTITSSQHTVACQMKE